MLSLRVELKVLEENQMAKTSKRAGQAAGVASSQPPPPNVVENEPHFEFKEEKLDSETMRATLGVQDKLTNQENATETLAL